MDRAWVLLGFWYRWTAQRVSFDDIRPVNLGSPFAFPLRLALVTVFGVHTGLQHITVDELRAAWRRIEDLGYGWISIWDHFYGATGKPDDAECLEAVALQAALACE